MLFVLLHLLYTCSREDLITKTLKDIPKFNRETAEKEVDKFLLDAEMLKMYIQYEKEVERNPNFKVPDAENDEGFFTLQNAVILYVGFLAYSIVPDTIRSYIADQQVAGTWENTGIEFFDQWIDETTADATAKAIQRAARAAAEATAASTGNVVSLPDVE